MILGINPLADVSAAIVSTNGELITYNERERFPPRWKHSRKYYHHIDKVATLSPRRAVIECLKEAKATFSNIDKVVIPWNNDGLKEIIDSVPYKKNEKMIKWEKESLTRFSKTSLKKQILEVIPELEHCEFAFIDHHLAHAATALLSPFDNCLIVVADGHGDKYSLTVWEMYEKEIKLMFSYPYYNSLGWFYSAVTEFLGMKMKQDETKVMNLSDYAPQKLLPRMKRIVRINENGFEVDSSYLLYGEHIISNNPRFSDKFIELFGEPYKDLQNAYRYEDDVYNSYPAHIASAAQKITEDAIMSVIKKAISKMDRPPKNVVLAGGIFLNCKINSKVSEIIPNVFILPPAHDGGTAIGAAMLLAKKSKELESPFVGRSYSNKEVEEILENLELEFHECDADVEIANLLMRNEVVAVFRGKREMGPRALLNTSILVPSHIKQNYIRINNIKKSVLWRTRAPSMTYKEFMQITNTKPTEIDKYMLSVRKVKNEHYKVEATLSRRNYIRPQVTDDFYFLKILEEEQGCGCVLNTSLNQSGLAMAGSPYDAIDDCIEMGIKYLILNDYIVYL